MVSFNYFISSLFLNCMVLCVSSVLLDSPNPTNATEKECHDNPNIECFDYEDKQCVGVYETFGRKNCPFRCGYCPGIYPACEDTIDYCDELGDNVCNKEYYGGFLRKNCRKFCNFCTYPGQKFVSTTAKPTTTTTTQAATTTTKPDISTILPTGDACQDVISDCKQFNTESCAGVFRTWAIQNCPRTCGYCTNSLPCEDYEDCEKLPSTLCTDDAYKVLAETSCRKFCKLCTAPSTSTSPMTTSMPEATTKQQTSIETTTVKKTSANMTSTSKESSTMMMKTSGKSSTEMMMTTVSVTDNTASMKPQTSEKMSTEMMKSTSMPMTISTEMMKSTSMPMKMSTQMMKSTSMPMKMSTEMMKSTSMLMTVSTEMMKSTSMPIKMSTTSQNMNSMEATSDMMPSKAVMSSASAKVADPVVG